MLPLSSTKRRVTFALTLALLALAGYAAVFTLLSKNTAEVASLGAQAASLGEQSEAVQSARTLLDETEAERRILSSAFVQEERVIDFISEVEAAGQTAGVILEIESVEMASIPEGSTDEVTTLVALTSAVGSWDSVYHFIALLETLPFYTELTSVSIERHSEAEGGGSWRAIVRIQSPLIQQ